MIDLRDRVEKYVYILSVRDLSGLTLQEADH